MVNNTDIALWAVVVCTCVLLGLLVAVKHYQKLKSKYVEVELRRIDTIQVRHATVQEIEKDLFGARKRYADLVGRVAPTSVSRLGGIRRNIDR